MRGISARSLRAVLVVWMCVWAHCAEAASVIAGYQEIYRMNFEVINQAGLPAGWFVTSDGYMVAQVRPNHWVYGRAAHLGVVVPTEVAVGAVVPMTVPQLVRVAEPLLHSGAYDTEQFRSILLSRPDNMGVLYDPIAYTPVAWKSGEAELRIWLGDIWYRIIPMPGQSVSEALMAYYPFVVHTLIKKNASWTMSDTQELADLARAWGYLWRGHISFAAFRYRRDGGASEGSVTANDVGFSDVSPGSGWDIGEGGGGGNTGGGGGWDK